MSQEKQELPRWLAIGAGLDLVRLVPVDAPSNGPDVFCKLQDAEAAIAAERERCAAMVDPRPPAQPSDQGWLALELAAMRIRET